MTSNNHKYIEQRNKLISMGYYMLNYSTTDLSRIFGISRQMVEKIVKKILDSKLNKKS